MSNLPDDQALIHLNLSSTYLSALVTCRERKQLIRVFDA